MRRIAQFAAVIASAFIILNGVISSYGSALREPRFLDGWLLCGGMLLQLAFHLRKKRPDLVIGKATVWMRAHIFIGFIVVIIFFLHTDASLPKSLFGWLIWSAFVAVAISGVFGMYLTRSTPAKLNKETERVPFDSIPVISRKLALDMDGLALGAVDHAGSRSIADAYVDTLFDFFNGPRNIFAHLKNSRLPLLTMFERIDGLERYLDEPGKERLTEIRQLIVQKNGLDHQYAHLGLLKAWLFIHIPATYALIIFSTLHVVVIHAFSSGAP